MSTTNNFFVITGGPSSGKTTLVHALQAQGYRGVDEAARDVLKEEEQRGGDVVAYRSTTEFTEREFQLSLDNYLQAQQENPDAITFFDRGIVDVIAYARYRKLPVSDYMHQTALTYRYNNTVFIATPWQAIYVSDAERSETYKESVRIFHALAAIYREYGYSLVELPNSTVEERVAFVLAVVQQHEAID